MRLYRNEKEEQQEKLSSPLRDESQQGSVSFRPYKKGDFIGQKYEIYGVLGKGGFGVVYLVYSHESGSVCALKTFRDEYLDNAKKRELFRKEAQVWVDLERHPYLVRAYFVDEVAGRLYIAMEYIAPDEEGLNSLEAYLNSRPPDLAQTLRWSIQFCLGMEYAYSKGVRCHRDIKPANIMISDDKIIKISDFGLAGALGESRRTSEIKMSIHDGQVGLATMEGVGFGTPTHMPPEQFTNAAGCDERSDIYSYGVVLYQMATGGKLPFLALPPMDRSKEEMARFWREMHRLHNESPVPMLDSPLFPMIKKCLKKVPGERYQSFKALRSELEPFLERETGETIRPPEEKRLEAWEWRSKGTSLRYLGRLDEALRCYEEALKADSRDAFTWNGKGTVLNDWSRFDEAICCFDEAIELYPEFAYSWNNKGYSLNKLGRFEEAIDCLDTAIELAPRYASPWNNKGNSLASLGRSEEAIHCYGKAVEFNPQLAESWYNIGMSLDHLGRSEEAIHCYDKAIEINPQYADALNNKGVSLDKLGHHDEAISCYDKAIGINPGESKAWLNKGMSFRYLMRFDEALQCHEKLIQIDPRNPNAWAGKGTILNDQGYFSEAMQCFDKAIEINERQVDAWTNKALSLRRMGRFEEAIYCSGKAIEIEPKEALPWYHKALSEEKLGKTQDAIRSYRKLISLETAHEMHVSYAQHRLRELERGWIRNPQQLKVKFKILFQDTQSESDFRRHTWKLMRILQESTGQLGYGPDHNRFEVIFDKEFSDEAEARAWNAIIGGEILGILSEGGVKVSLEGIWHGRSVKSNTVHDN